MGRRLALVTGAARRIGRAIALALAREGHDLVLHHHRSTQDAERTARDCVSLGAKVLSLPADLRRVPEIEALARELAARFGALHLLVHNASSFHRTPFGQVSEADFDDLVATNLKAPFFLSQALLPLLEAADDPQIVHLLDVSAERPWPELLPYCAAKAGLRALTRGLAIELSPRVRVNAVAPGPALLPEGLDPATAERIRASTLLGRLGSPEEIAEAVVFLAKGPRSMQGTVITVDGGRRLSGGGAAEAPPGTKVE